MIPLHLLAVALLTASTALSAVAEEHSAASAPMAAASMPGDCAKPMAKHDHGAEKGMPMPMSMSGPCAQAAIASAPTSKVKAKAKLNHDHAKFHKNQ